MNREEMEQMIDEEFWFLSEIERCNFKNFILDKMLPEVFMDIMSAMDSIECSLFEDEVKEKYKITI